jgi:hypothetical protein
MRLATAHAVVLATLPALGCSTLTPDPESDASANPLGNGQRIADVQNPNSQSYQQALAQSKASTNSGVRVDLSSLVVTWVDTFDETRDGKSIGTVYVQDVGSQAPYAGMSVYQPNYVPAALRPLPGDVLDMVGPYQELSHIGAANFNPNTLPQLAKPVGTFRYEFRTNDPVVISLSDIDQGNYAKGRQWESMLVTVENVTIGAGTTDTKTGLRVTYPMGDGDASISGNAAAVSNELVDISSTQFPAGTHFKSVTGLVTWFFSYHIAPRTLDDLKQ